MVNHKNLVLIIIFLCPPAGVLMMNGFSTTFIVNLFLLPLALIPSYIHALYVYFRYSRKQESAYLRSRQSSLSRMVSNSSSKTDRAKPFDYEKLVNDKDLDMVFRDFGSGEMRAAIVA